MSYGIYIHIPFCKRKCKYCDFVSYSGREEYFSEYIASLLKEAKEYEGKKADTVFIGGGTPSVLSGQDIKTLISGIRETFDIEKSAEFSIEVNPGTVDEEKISVLKEAGVNRISVGVQSFSDIELEYAGRIHSSYEAKKCIELIKNAGFDNFNIDLMLSLPGQDIKSLEKTINTALLYAPAHISCYSLILEEGTVLYDEYTKGKYPAEDDDKDREYFSYVKKALSDNGYRNYEISNFAKPGYECRHNIKYWNCDEYIGLGVAAHSYLDGRRYSNTSDLFGYIGGKYRSGKGDILSKKDMISEYIIMRMRLSDGIKKEDFYKRFGENIEDIYGKELDKFISSGLITADDTGYRLSARGVDISNSVLCEFV